MPPRNVEDIFPLTPMQRLMLLHTVSNPDAGTLVNQVRYQVEGPLNGGIFGEALAGLVERHAALRTAILWKGLERPLNVVREIVEVPFDRVDLSDVEGAVQDAAVKELAERDRGAFELGRAPLMRCTLVRLATERHLLIWTLHHLVVDRWSHEVMMSDLRCMYEGRMGSPAPDLPSPARFREYAVWVDSRPQNHAEHFWREHLEGVVRPTYWMPGWRRSHRAPRARTQAFVNAEESRRLEARAHDLKTTPATLMLAAIGLFLAERNGLEDPVTGLTVSGRPADLDGVEEAVGSFVGNVPLRYRIRADISVATWVRELQQTQVRRQPFEYASAADIEEWAGLRPNQPLYDGLVVLNLLESGDEVWSDVRLRPVSATLDAGYPWVLEVARESHVAGSGLRMTLVHDRDAVEVEVMLEDLRKTIVRLVSASPETRLGDLAVIELSSASSSESSDGLASGTSSYSEEASFLEQEILAAWREILGQPDLGPDDDFFDLGGTSLQAARLFHRLEQITGRVLSLSMLLEARSVRGMLIALEAPTREAGPLVGIRPGSEICPIVAVPGIGGNVIGLYPLARELGKQGRSGGIRPFYGLQSRGLDGRDDPFTSIGQIAEDFAEHSQDVAQGGVHLVGACWGAVVAFELAHRLQARGCDVLSLALIDPAPILRLDTPDPTSVTRTFIRDRMRAYWSSFQEGTWTERVGLIREKSGLLLRLARTGGTTGESESELNARAVKAANTVAVDRYDPEPLDVRARVFFTEGSWRGPEDPRLEWLDFLSPRPEVFIVPGVDSGDAIDTHATTFAGEISRWHETLDTPKASDATETTR